MIVLPIASASGEPPQRVPDEHIELPYLTDTTKSATAITKMNTDVRNNRNLGCTDRVFFLAIYVIIPYPASARNEKNANYFRIFDERNGSRPKAGAVIGRLCLRQPERLSGRATESAFFATELYESMRLSENADSLRQNDKRKGEFSPFLPTDILNNWSRRKRSDPFYDSRMPKINWSPRHPSTRMLPNTAGDASKFESVSVPFVPSTAPVSPSSR